MMPTFATLDALREWLNGRSMEVALCLASRTALRGFPAFHDVCTSDISRGVDPYALAPPVLRGMAAAWIVGAQSERNCTRTRHAVYVAAAGAMSARAQVLAASDNAQAVASAAAFVAAATATYFCDSDVQVRVRENGYCNLGCGPAHLAHLAGPDERIRPASDPGGLECRGRKCETVPSSAVIDVVVKTAQASGRLVDVVKIPAYSGLSLDATALDEGMSLPQLAAEPLWRRAEFRESAGAAWLKLRQRFAALPAADEWGVWIDWYDARMRGDPVDWDREIARLIVSESHWDRGTPHINRCLKAIVVGAPRAAPASISA